MTDTQNGTQNEAGDQTPAQLNRESLQNKTPEQIVAELNAGQYDDLLNSKK